MKTRQLIVSVLLTLCMTAYAQADWGNIGKYAQENQSIVAQPNNGQRVVFMGNSITENWRNMRPEFFTSNGYIGRGISGQTSYQFLVRFREDVVALHPRVVIINAGTNDVAENTGPYDEERTLGNIISMTEIARANGIKVILTTVLPCSEFGWHREIKDASEKIASLNARIKAYADSHQLGFIDYYTPLVYGERRQLNPKYTQDGCHPTVAGYEIMEPIAQEAIRKAMK